VSEFAKRDVYQEVTDRIIASLEKGAAPWVKPWSASNGFGLPSNASTGRLYNGVNVFLLWAVGAVHGYEHDRWLTFKQCQGMKGRVRKGEKATLVIYWNIQKRIERDENGTPRERKIFLLRHYNVFNVAQCDGLPERATGTKTPAATLTEAQRLQAAETFIAHCGAKITHGGAQAFYSPAADAITLPRFETFKDGGAYYATALHELTHWTGHASRTNRGEAFGNRFGSDAYAAEELVAEMGSAFACASLGIQGTLQHPEYIAHWLKVMRGDNKAIITAASKATAAHKYLTDLQPGAAEMVGAEEEEAEVA
jgi:antirestriction protein ArdC